jgi:hypothetical protein
MSAQQALMPIIVASVVGFISRASGESEEKSLECFYKSRVYSLLEDEGSKFWTMGDVALADMFAKEQADRQLVGAESENR